MESHLSRSGGREIYDEYFLHIFSTLSLVTKESIAILWGSMGKPFHSWRSKAWGPWHVLSLRIPSVFSISNEASLYFLSFITNLVRTPALTSWCSLTLYCVSILECIEISSTKEIRPFPFHLSSGRFSGQYPKAVTSFAKILQEQSLA